MRIRSLLLLLAISTKSLHVTSYCSVASIARPFERRATSLHSLSEPDRDVDYSTEETLLCVRLDVQPNVSLDEALEKVAKYSQSFPFAAVLPVQPLTYLPTDDNGVEIKFLRKKTELKSGVDGGIRFFLEPVSDNSLELTAKRNSKGQSISKIFAEKLVVTSFISGLTGEEPERSTIVPKDVVSVKSIYHKWM